MPHRIDILAYANIIDQGLFQTTYSNIARRYEESTRIAQVIVAKQSTDGATISLFTAVVVTTAVAVEETLEAWFPPQ